jgi:serine O-acetyltransferase
VINPVPTGRTVVGIPGRVVEDGRSPLSDLEHGQLPDPVAEAIRLVLREQDKLEERLRRVESSSGILTPGDELEEERLKVERGFSQGGGI